MVLLRKRPGLLLLFFLFASVCLAQFKSRKITCKQDSGLTFPLFISDNKTAAKKINDHLQMEFFETTTSQTPEAKLFDEYRFIFDDSMIQPGYTSISYRIESNNPKILSVLFEVEGMGAYPTYYKRYFTFYNNTGAPISTDTLFTTAGLKTIKEILVKKRKEEIKEWIRSLKADNETPYAEDSSFIADNFAACNAEADESKMYIRKGKILFYKYDCFPHAWGPYETNLDIEFTYKELEKYLSAFGKKLLFTK
ncbi:MAG TPA: hypothetical protein VF144_07810 [Chitinophagaceae bacterium]